MRRFFMMALPVLLIGVTPALAWKEPARGSALRSALTDAARPHAEWLLGAPVEFVVSDMRVEGALGFAAFRPQRPGGGVIDINRTPMVTRDGWDAATMDGVGMQVLYQKSGETWVAVHWQIGATDVWYSWDAFCDVWHPVIAEACN